MTIRELVCFAESNPLTEAIMNNVCDKNSLTLEELYLAFAKNIAEEYSKSEYSWSFCDGSINALFAYAYGPTDSGLPKYAYDVFTAFDEGEYIHKGDPADFDHELRTKAILKEIQA